MVAQARDYRYLQGRFLSRDPAGFADSKNTYQAVDSRPTRKIDPYGTWGEDVHLDLTKDISKKHLNNYISGIIAQADQGIDEDWGTKYLPVWMLSGQPRHLKYAGEKYGSDSRLYWWNLEREKASEYLIIADEQSKKNYCDKAAEAFGRGLHSLQEISAHRPWPTGGSWHSLTIHPGWWDDYFAGASGSITINAFARDDRWWAKQAQENGWASEYMPWVCLESQITSQFNASISVLIDTTTSIELFDYETKGSKCCNPHMH
jgi:uncharacterized protein RhaS with RHS repeats